MSILTCSLAALLFASTLHAQTSQSGPSTEDLRYVLPHGVGDIAVQLEGLKPQQMSLLDDGTRLVVQFGKQDTDLVVSYLLFPNPTGNATSEGCRSAIMTAVLADITGNGTVADQQQSTRKTRAGIDLAVAAYRITKAGDRQLDQENVFGFYGNTQTCFEIHISKPRYKAVDKPLFDAALDSFKFHPDYLPTAADYGLVATLFFNYLQDFKSAAIYYQRALETLPKTEVTAPDATVLGRVTVVQLAMSYGMSGDLASSRAVSEAAIERDPSYPLYYYNLANADAEAGEADLARKHLQQAFDRRKNILPGMSMPDPTKDDSFLKLKSDRSFWTFVQSLPKD